MCIWIGYAIYCVFELITLCNVYLDWLPWLRDGVLVWLVPRLYLEGLFCLVAEYENDNQEGENYIYCSDLNARDRDKDKACLFNLHQLGDCKKENTYGYFEGQPCILLKFNKVRQCHTPGQLCM